jgi:hypothetical protein
MFQKVVLNSAVEALSDKKLEAQKAVELVRKNVLIPATKVAVNNYNMWKSHLEAKQAEAKNVLATAEGKLQQMQQPNWIPNPYTIGEIKGAIDIINAIHTGLGKLAQEYADAFMADGYRGAFIDNIHEAFPQIGPKDLEQFKSFVESARSKIIADNRVLNAIRDRVAEYGKRCSVVHDTAQTAQKKALGASVNVTARLQKAVSDCQAAEAATVESLRKVQNKISAITDTLKKKKDANTGKLIQGLLGERAENIKKASGSLKTLLITFNEGEKVFNESPTKDIVKQFAVPMVKLKKSLAELQKQSDEVKTKACVMQDKVIVAAGYKTR